MSYDLRTMVKVEGCDEFLKPCPWCGESPQPRSAFVPIEWVNDGPILEEQFVRECDNDDCPVQPQTEFFRTQEEADRAWNRRANDADGETPLPSRLEGDSDGRQR